MLICHVARPRTSHSAALSTIARSSLFLPRIVGLSARAQRQHDTGISRLHANRAPDRLFLHALNEPKREAGSSAFAYPWLRVRVGAQGWPRLGSGRRVRGWRRNVYDGTCRPSSCMEASDQEDLAAPEAPSVTSVSLPRRRLSCITLLLCPLAQPFSGRVASNVSTRYTYRCVSGAFSPASCSLQAAPASPPSHRLHWAWITY